MRLCNRNLRLVWHLTSGLRKSSHQILPHVLVKRLRLRLRLHVYLEFVLVRDRRILGRRRGALDVLALDSALRASETRAVAARCVSEANRSSQTTNVLVARSVRGAARHARLACVYSSLLLSCVHQCCCCFFILCFWRAIMLVNVCNNSSAQLLRRADRSRGFRGEEVVYCALEEE